MGNTVVGGTLGMVLLRNNKLVKLHLQLDYWGYSEGKNAFRWSSIEVW